MFQPEHLPSYTSAAFFAAVTVFAREMILPRNYLADIIARRTFRGVEFGRKMRLKFIEGAELRKDIARKFSRSIVAVSVGWPVIVKT